MPSVLHMFIDDIDPAQWQVDLFYKNGQRVPFELNRTAKGVAVSFRPDKEKFQEKRIGDYYLIFRADKLGAKKNFEFPTRLEVSDYRFKEHLQHGR